MHKNIKIEFNTEDAAFDDNADAELDFVMENIKKAINRGHEKIHDSNGNTIGRITYSD